MTVHVLREFLFKAAEIVGPKPTDFPPHFTGEGVIVNGAGAILYTGPSRHAELWAAAELIEKHVDELNELMLPVLADTDLTSRIVNLADCDLKREQLGMSRDPDYRRLHLRGVLLPRFISRLFADHGNAEPFDAAYSTFECLEQERLPLEVRTIIAGVELTAPIELDADLTLEKQTDAQQGEAATRFFMEDRKWMHDAAWRADALLRHHYSAALINIGDTTGDAEREAMIWRVIGILRVAAGRSVTPVLIERSVRGMPWTSHQIWSYPRELGWPAIFGGVVRIDKDEVRENWKRLELAIRRINDASTRDRRDDGFLDLWIGLEALFGADTEITFRLALRLATALEKSADQRVSLFSAVKKSYGLRSKIVHGARELPEAEVDGPFATAFSWLQKGIVWWLALTAACTPDVLETELLSASSSSAH